MPPKTIYSLGRFLFFFLWVGVGIGQEENPLLSIRILEKQNLQELEVRCPPNRGYRNEVKLTRGQMTVNGKAQKRASWGSPGDSVKIRFKNLTRIYPGQITLSLDPSSQGSELLVLDGVPLEDYAACVTAFESGHDRSQPEYLKALGVIVRAYALSHRRRHPGYDLCDLSHCQVYQGLPPHFEFWKQMLEAGKGFNFPAGTDLKSLYFHRCCGGMLESADQIWGGVPSPSRTGPDTLKGEVLCKADSFYKWTSSTRAESIELTFKSIAHLSLNTKLRSLQVVEKTAHGRNKILSAFFELPDGESREVQENTVKFVSEFGKRYGWRIFPSLWFDVRQKGDTYYFAGHGFGHGVGLCQSGALRLAQMGWNWEQILKFYFPVGK